MADYSIIADISRYLAGVLRERMCPELILAPSQIEIADPGEKGRDYILGLFLYHMEEEKEVSLPRFREIGKMAFRQPPKLYRLYFMVFINPASQANYKSVDVQRIIGRTAQVLGDRMQVSPNLLQPWLEMPEPPVILSQAQISLETKLQIWQAVGQPYRFSLFFFFSPVLISSENIMDVVPVREVQVSLEKI